MSILVIGDSFSAPSNIKVWPEIIAERTGEVVINRAVPGSGYVALGIGSQPAPFSRQLLASSPNNVELIVIFGSCNDRTIDKDILRLTIWQTHLEAGRRYPNARLLIVGPQWAGLQAVPGDMYGTRQALVDAMWSYDFQNGYLDPINELNMWFPSNRLDLVGADQFHPNQIGQTLIADRVEGSIRNQLNL